MKVVQILLVTFRYFPFLLLTSHSTFKHEKHETVFSMILDET